MLNTSKLRQQYGLERATMTQNKIVGAIVLTVISLIWASIIVALIIRFSCVAIVAAHHLIK